MVSTIGDVLPLGFQAFSILSLRSAVWAQALFLSVSWGLLWPRKWFEPVGSAKFCSRSQSAEAGQPAAALFARIHRLFAIHFRGQKPIQENFAF